jgi:hypothetical protein
MLFKCGIMFIAYICYVVWNIAEISKKSPIWKINERK